MEKKGFLVVLCGPSQFGKDYIINNTSKKLEKLDIDTAHPTVYKVRSKRESDPDYVRCVESETDIPIASPDRLEYRVYGQECVYSKSEIESILEQGKIAFVGTGDPDFASKLKEQFYNNSLCVFVRGYAVGAEQMVKTEFSRKGLEIANINSPEGEEILSSMAERFEHIKSLEPQYEQFMQDKTNGADYIYTNYYTMFGGHWNTYFDNKEKSEEDNFVYLIEDIYKRLNEKECPSWRDEYLFQIENTPRNGSPYNLNDEWCEYIEQKD